MKDAKTIGILGGGQLGRMLALAAYDMGYGCVVWDESAEAPALRVTDKTIVAPYGDEAARRSFTDMSDVVLLEFENIPVELVGEIQKTRLVAPSAEVLAVVQNRVKEKSFFDDNGIACAAWAAVNSEEEALLAGQKVGYPLILKTCRFGYDGKGQGRAENDAEIRALWHKLGGGECIAEAFIKFDKEASVIGVRTPTGEQAIYEVAENIHENHILRTSQVPAQLSAKAADMAKAYLQKAMEALDIVGLLALEVFIVGDEVLANEMAARPHNSGHWTMDAAETSQFEQAVRAVVGLSPGATRRHSEVLMRNLLGDEIDKIDWHDATARIHLYGKNSARPGRKMGHINFLKRGNQ